MDKIKQSEKGQAIVLLALAIIVLLGFTALAIDGGMAFSDRRHAQNASDASSLAGGGAAAITLDNNNVNYDNWNCADPKISILARQEAVNAAIGRAASNGYILDDDASDLNGVLFECGSQYTGGWWEKYIDVTTKVSSTTDAYLAGLFFDGQFTNNVNAITRIRPRSPIGGGYAVVALNDGPCDGNQNGVLVGGSNETNLSGGGIFSNGCFKCSGNSFILDITSGDIRFGEEQSCGGANISADSYGSTPITMPDYMTAVPMPNCSAPGATNYNTPVSLNNGTLTLPPGLHCFNASPNALTINGGDFTAIGVTIFAPTGNISIGGNGTLNMTAPIRIPDPSPAIPGVLIYSTSTLNNAVNLEGNSNSQFHGTVYAPNTTIKATGNSTGDTDPTFSTQLIGKNVDIRGTVNFDIYFNGYENFNFPPKLELYK
jgi:Flp pilus assembly protein TadG